MVIPLSIHVADDDLPALRRMRGDMDLRAYFMARLEADYRSVVEKGRRVEETHRMIQEGAIEAVYSGEDGS